MKEIKKSKLERDEHYLVFCGYEYSPSGYDLAQFYQGKLVSQTTNEDLLVYNNGLIKVYELPVN